MDVMHARVALMTLLLGCGRFNFDERAAVEGDACVAGGACTPSAVCFDGVVPECGLACTRTQPREGDCPGGTCATGMCVGPAGTPLVHPPAGNNAYFGAAVDSDGTRMVVGAVRANAAYVLENQGGWKVVATLTSTWGPANSYFGGAVAIEGDRIVVGARYSLGPTLSTGFGGAIVIYERTSVGWTEVAQVLGPNQGEFGGAVDLDGGRILVGAEYANTVANAYGTAYIVENTGASWSVVSQFTEPPADRFGHFVQLRGDRAFVGSLWDPSAVSTECGGVRIYERANATTWTLTATLQGDDMRADAFGQGFSVDGDRIAIGVPWFYNPSRGEGAVWVYTRSAAGWASPGPIIPSSIIRDANFGRGIYLQGDRMFVTSIDWNTNDLITHVYRHELDDSWLEVARRIHANGGNESGFSIGGIEVDFQMTAVGDDVVVGMPISGYAGGLAPGAVLFHDAAGL